jgi:competence protein ComEA
MIVIPSIDEQLAIPESRAGSELVIDSPVNINTATPEQLQRLPGLGPVKAAAIIDYRQQHGPFQSIEDLKEVPGIGDGIIEDIKNWIVFY